MLKRRLSADRSGFVLGMILLLSMVMAAAIYSYHRTVMQQNRVAHHELIGEIAGRLAASTAHILAEELNIHGKYVVTPAFFPQLFSSTVDPSQEIQFPSQILEPLLDDINAYLARLKHLQSSWGPPHCREISLKLSNIKKMSPGTSNVFDPVEKSADLTITCNIEFQKLARKAEIIRKCKVVSFNPGPFARFSLFVPYTPWQHSYNSVGLNYTGQIHPNYEFPIPQNKKYTGTLKVINGNYFGKPGDGSSFPDLEKDIFNRGWVFLGPWKASVGDGPVVLRLGSGYDSPGGTNYMFGFPTRNDKRQLIFNPEKISIADIQTSGADFSDIKVTGIFQGFYTIGESSGYAYSPLGILNEELWPSIGSTTVTDVKNCASSWLLPYGDLQRPSRTLMVGPVLASFAKYYQMEGKAVLNPPSGPMEDFKGRIMPRNPPNSAQPSDGSRIYYALDPVYLKRTDRILQVSKYNNVFKGDDSGYETFKKVKPIDFSPRSGPFEKFAGISYNSFFEAMAYTTLFSAGRYPAFGHASFDPVSQQGAIQDILPKKYDENGVPQPKGLFSPFLSMKIPADAGKVKYYEDDIATYSVDTILDSGRITHFIDLSTCKDQMQENRAFCSAVFGKAGDNLDLEFKDFGEAEDVETKGFFAPSYSFSSWYVPRFPGIVYVVRRKNLNTQSPQNPAQNDELLSLPAKVLLQSNLMIIADRGDIVIPGPLISPRDKTTGFPKNLCTIVALEGNIALSTQSEIDAYLVALAHGSGASSQGGRLLSGDAGVKKMNIFGGLAIWEMGLYDNQVLRVTMWDFPEGGLIRYNPAFNHNIDNYYSESRQVIIDNKNQYVRIFGGE
ncbi:MAG: hypothetical protein HQM10_20865 [Candidatus Riflebacteria bacterium]|nr:hypothetical protein [Candidatus Riflebacteria bacterium]